MNDMVNYTEKDNQFYPTPQALIDKMLEGLDLRYVASVLEPSAGKGNIVESLMKKYNSIISYYCRNVDLDVDCIEIDKNLQAILKNKQYKVVWDDFLTFNPFKKYDLIIMNPPFKDGEEHLLKALDLQKNGGDIVCILNAETIKNPYSNKRKVLLQILNKHNADIKYINDTFSKAERKTDVEVALIKIHIEATQQENPWWEQFQKAEEYKYSSKEDETEIIIDDYIKKAVQLFNIEVKSSLELIKHYQTLEKHINFDMVSDLHFENPILKLTIFDDKYDTATVNCYLKKVRLKYWKALFSNPKFMSKLTSNMQDEFREKVDKLQEYDFNEFNINNLIVEMNASIQQGVKETIVSLFDTLTHKYSYYPECDGNIHYYNGWKTNIAHKINYKVIIPCHAFEKQYFSNRMDFCVSKALDLLQDIEKTLNYLDGNMTKQVDLKYVIEESQNNPKNIECKFFKVTFYKKGTCHITFTNQELIDKFNIYVGKNKNWLPPYYGNVKYDDMPAEEQKVVDEFQGKEQYNKVYRNKNYYLNTNDLLKITQND